MLEFTLNRHHTGLTPWGDHATLSRLHRVIHAVVEGSVVIEDKEGFVLGLAYDVRKAFEEQRRQDSRTHGDDKSRIYGVEILWPVVLVQVGVLRHAMGFLPTDKGFQAAMYDLEDVVESAVRRAVPKAATNLIEWIARLGALPYKHLDSVPSNRCCYFIELELKRRLASLLPLMESFDPMLDFLAEHGTLKPGMIPPSAFARGERE